MVDHKNPGRGHKFIKKIIVISLIRLIAPYVSFNVIRIRHKLYPAKGYFFIYSRTTPHPCEWTRGGDVMWWPAEINVKLIFNKNLAIHSPWEISGDKWDERNIISFLWICILLNLPSGGLLLLIFISTKAIRQEGISFNNPWKISNRKLCWGNRTICCSFGLLGDPSTTRLGLLLP